MTSQAFDIVTVPDFSGPIRREFELRTLFFMAFWQEYGGKCRSYPMHLACIGEPPDSVRALARQCGAKITVHEPYIINKCSSSNKIRGFEVERVTDHLLLLDTDVLMLKDFGALAHFRGVLAAAPAFRERVPEVEWHKLYACLGMPLPTERFTLERKSQSEQAKSLGKSAEETCLPYFNAGIISAPWSYPLSEVWIDLLKRIGRYYGERQEADCYVRFGGDQVGFAIAIQELKRRGMAFQFLPGELHGHWQHLQQGILSMSQIMLFHATHQLIGLDERLLASWQFLGIGPKWIYQNMRGDLMMRAGVGNYSNARELFNWAQTIRGIALLTSRYQRLYNKYLRDLIQ